MYVLCTLIPTVVEQMDFFVLRFVRLIASAWNVLIQVQNYRTLKISNIWQMVLASLKQNPFSKHKNFKKWWYSPQDLQNQKYWSTTTLSFRKRVQNVRLKEIRIKTRSSRSTKLQMLVESLKIAASQLLLGIFLRCSDQASEFLPTASPPFDR